jgi:cobalt-zinc-cadmium efflux system protein
MRDEHMHDEHNNHNHDVSKMNGSKLFLVIILNLIITISEVIGGLISGSLSLISDALHNLSDTVSIALSYFSIKISRKPKNKTKTYGYKRANILSAFINSSALIGISIFLFIEAFRKFFIVTPVQGNTVIIVAIIGLLGNLFSVILLSKDSKQSINLKSSYLHLLSDTLSSVVVIVSGILIKYYNAYWTDPLFTIIINIMILRSGFSVLKESVEILMQSAPTGLDIDKIKEYLNDLDLVQDVHHIHIWRLDDQTINIECHIKVKDMALSETKPIYDKIIHSLHEKYNINHCVIQFETENCDLEHCDI